jgi:hypothetical protein
LVEQAAALAIAAAAAAGLADDLKGDRSARGLKGHFRRLRQGQVTTGLVKLVAVGAGAAIFATVNQFAGQTSPARPRPRRRSLAGRLVMAAADAALVAGAANLVNLLDLRPGRALKAAGATAALLAAAPGAGGGLAAGAVGAALAAAPGDLAEQTMLGDCGANALGACVGAAAVMSLPRPARMAAAAAVAGLILASEKLSFSQVIAANPTLRRIDDWGREDSPADGSAGEQG